MMAAEQELLGEDLLKDETAVKLNQCKISSNANDQRNYAITKKLGSDGESEASPESSLSPVEVDSLEEGGSDGRQSTEATDSETLLESLTCEEQQKQPFRENISDCESDAKFSELNFENNNKEEEEDVNFLESNEREVFSVIEEEQEPDSLEEFIKNENECMKEETLVAFENTETETVKENEYEEIDGPKNDESPSVRDEPTTRDPCVPSNQNLIDFEVDTCTHQLQVRDNCNNSLVTQCDLLAIESVPIHNSVGMFTSNTVPNDLPSEQTKKVIDESASVDVVQLRNEADICKQKNGCKPHIIGQTYQHLSDSVSNTKQPPETVKPDNVNEKEIILKSTENKIAEEIREQKQREEELRKMREEIKLKQAAIVDSVTAKHSVSNGCINGHNGHNGGRISPTVSEMSSASSSAVSSDSLDTFSSRSSDRVKVKPLMCENDTTTYTILSESPIEREIRISKEREDALRQEKNRLSKFSESNDFQKKSPQPTAIKSPVLKSFSTGTSINTTNIQKVLATTRIQQEIEEQTQREIELKEKGSIKTISHERTDVKVTKLGEIEKITSKQLPVSPTPVNGDSAYESLQPISSPKENCVTNGNKIKRKISLPQIFGFGAPKNVSMHKFISSKGKSNSLNPSFTSFISTTNGGDFHQLRPPLFLKGEKGIRRAIPAESKIQEELKEMKAREEELKWQRARLIGKSHPNLATLESELDDQCPETEEKNIKVTGISANLLKRTTSIPNIIDDDEKKPQVCQFAIGAAKKRNPLIEQWELKIQKFVKTKK